VPGGADVLQLADRADPVELERVVTRADGAEQRVHGDVVGERADGAAVAVGGGVDRRRRGEAARRRLVLCDEGRIARDMPAHVARQRAVVDVVTAAGAAADDQVDLPAFVEVLDGLGGGRKDM
jgi:hypothetical protein